MIICKTPLRISYFGGGTDFPNWYKKKGGQVISSSIDKFCYLMIRNLPPFFHFNFRIRYFKSEFTKKVNEINHPSIREAIKKYHKSNSGLEIIHSSDLPSQSGLGSSSAFSVCLIKGLKQLNGKIEKNRNIALEAINFEQNVLKEKVGSQDQYACAVGGFNIIKFGQKINHKKINLKNNKIKNIEKLSSLFFVGFPRNAQLIEEDKFKNLKNKIRTYEDMYTISNEARHILLKKNSFNFIKNFNQLMNENWKLKKNLSNYVSNNFIDEIYDYAIQNGAQSGKILGAGAGGFMLFVSKDKNDKKKLIKALTPKLKYVNFKFEDTGASIIFDKRNDIF
jgi:D-glycero-alpha-D-manno-heptose-7-phosphate kinase